MTLYAGIDLHSNNNVIVVVNEKDEVVKRRRLENTMRTVLAFLEPYRAELAGVVVESTYNWYWLVDGLQDHGYRVHLANTAAIPQYEGLKYGDDDSDARWRATLLRLGLLPEGHIYPRAEVRKLTGEGVDQLGLEPDLGLAIKANVAVLSCLREQIDLVEQTLLSRVRLRKPFKRLLTVDGIGKVLGLTIMLETGDIRRFAGVGNYVSYCRCVNSRWLSNGKRKGQGNTKNGNKYLAWAFVEATHYAIQWNDQIRRFYQRKCAKTMRVVAIKAVAHKLARACYHILGTKPGTGTYYRKGRVWGQSTFSTLTAKDDRAFRASFGCGRRPH